VFLFAQKKLFCVFKTLRKLIYTIIKTEKKKDNYLGTTNATKGGIGFLLHPSFVLDAQTLVPYGFSDVKIWNRPLEKVILMSNLGLFQIKRHIY
jgi:hypothetical protein